jgi:Sec-independent protein translocase protein TatA
LGWGNIKEENLYGLAKNVLSKLVNKSCEKVLADVVPKVGRKFKKGVNRFRKTAHNDNRKHREKLVKKQKNFRIKTVDLIKKPSKHKRYVFKKTNENSNINNCEKNNFEEEE